MIYLVMFATSTLVDATLMTCSSCSSSGQPSFDMGYSCTLCIRALVLCCISALILCLYDATVGLFQVL